MCTALAESHIDWHEDVKVEILGGGYDMWYEGGFPCCKCKQQRCRKGAALAETELAPSCLPPVLLLADTHCLYHSLREERWDEATKGATSAGKRVEHMILEELAKAARRVRPELQARKLRVAFVGALSGDVPMVEHAFFDIVKQMGLAEGRAVKVFAKRILGTGDRAYLERADVILIGGCVNIHPELRDAIPDAQAAPVGPLPGLHAMHEAKIFDALRTARSQGAVCVGIVEGSLALSDGFVHELTAEGGGDLAEDEMIQPRFYTSHRPPAPGIEKGESSGRCGGVLPGLLIGIGEDETSRWPALCAALAEGRAGAPNAAESTDAPSVALGMPAKSGVLCYPDGAVSAIGESKVTWLKPNLQLASGTTPPEGDDAAAATTQGEEERAKMKEPPGPVGALLRTLLVPSVAPFEAPLIAKDGTPKSKGPLWEGPDRTAALKLEQAVAKLAGCKRIVAFTGAGISAESMIPTFRETVAANEPVDAHGNALKATAIDKLAPLWTQVDPDQASHIESFHEDPAKWWEGEMQMVEAFDATAPNAAHHALAKLQEAGLLAGVVTQNIDGLHQAAGCTPKSVIELHGTMHRMECAGVPRSSFTGAGSKGSMMSDADLFRQAMSGKLDDRCGWTCAMSLGRVKQARADGRAPGCPNCGGYLKTATVLFGEQLPDKAQAAAKRLILSCDALLIVGTSLNVYPAASYPTMVRNPTSHVAPALRPDSQRTYAADAYPGDTEVDHEGWRANTRKPSPIIEVNAMHPTSPAAPDVMITGRAGVWLPQLAERLIEEKIKRDPPPPPPPPADAKPKTRWVIDSLKGWTEVPESEMAPPKPTPSSDVADHVADEAEDEMVRAD